jgi:hypothetical protein
MTEPLVVGPGALSPATRRRVDRDAWLLWAWWLAVGLVATVLLHRIGGVRSPLWRYPLTALVMYVPGEVLALRAWLTLFARSARLAPLRWRVATEEEHAWQPRISRRTLAFAGAFVTGLVVLGYAVEILMRLSHAFAIAVFFLIAVIALIALVMQWLPGAASSSTLMADLALDFVFGHFRGRRDALPPRPQSESLATIVGETWPRGVAILVFAAVAAAALALLRPGAESIVDAFR